MTEPLPFDQGTWEQRGPEVPPRGSPSVNYFDPSDRDDSLRHRSLNRLWLFQERLRFLQQVETNLPTFRHSIAVSVVGGPKADLKRVWQLALATAFGRYRQAGVYGFQSADVRCVWDITGKSVQVILSYQNSGVLGVLNDFVSKSPEEFIIDGPTQETVGAPVVSWLNGANVRKAATVGAGIGSVVGGVVLRGGLTGARLGAVVGAAILGLYAKSQNAKDTNAGNLPDAGRVITTGVKTNENVQPPAPSYDNLSRTFPLVALISNALTDPGYLPAVPPQRLRPLKGKEVSEPLAQETKNRNLPGFVTNDAVVAAFGGVVAAASSTQPKVNPTFFGRGRDDGYEDLPVDVANVQGEVNQ